MRSPDRQELGTLKYQTISMNTPQSCILRVWLTAVCAFPFELVSHGVPLSARPQGSLLWALLGVHLFSFQLVWAQSSGLPAISAQPISQVIMDGDSVTFSVSATGAAPMAFQWIKNGVAIAGATGTSYSITGAVPSDAGSYRVVLSNSLGTITSNEAFLVVNDVAPVIVVQPVGVTLPDGHPFTLTVEATGTLPLMYQWSKDGVAVAGAAGRATRCGTRRSQKQEHIRS